MPSVKADAAMDSLETSIAQMNDEQRHELLEAEEQALASTDPEELTQLASHPSDHSEIEVAENSTTQSSVTTSAITSPRSGVNDGTRDRSRRDVGFTQNCE